jgi:AcrR family transcriptional regulator
MSSSEKIAKTTKSAKTAKAARAVKTVAQTPRPASRSRRAYHKGNVAQDLFAAAQRLLDTEALEALTVRRLCREVGVTAANFYNHYPSLEHLLLDVAAAGMEWLASARDRIARRGLSRNQSLVALTNEIVDFGVTQPDLFRLMFGQLGGHAGHPRYYAAAGRAFAALVTMIYADTDVVFRPDDVAWSHANCQKAYAYFSFFYGLARLVSMDLITFPTRSKAERHRFVSELTLIFIRGLDAPDGPATA